MLKFKNCFVRFIYINKYYSNEYLVIKYKYLSVFNLNLSIFISKAFKDHGSICCTVFKSYII